MAIGTEQWRIFDLQTNELQVHSEIEPGDEDLLNAAAAQTILNGGTVYAIEPEEILDQAALAAMFRY